MYDRPRTLLEQQCMTFCAIMKAMEGHLTEHNILSTCDKVWNWTKVTLGTEVMNTPPTIGGDIPNPPVDIEPRSDGLESRKILITNLEVKKGNRKDNNKPYTRWTVTDEGGLEYTTFNSTVGSQLEIGKSYGIAFRFKQNGKYTSRELEAVTPVEDDDDQPYIVS